MSKYGMFQNPDEPVQEWITYLRGCDGRTIPDSENMITTGLDASSDTVLQVAQEYYETSDDDIVIMPKYRHGRVQ